MNNVLKEGKFDWIGIVASVMCLVHCLAVPLVLMFNKELNLHELAVWEMLQLGFALLSFWAIWHVTGHTQNKWIKLGFWVSFLFLLAGIFAHHSPFGEVLNYLAATLLISFHVYNLSFGQQKLVHSHQ